MAKSHMLSAVIQVIALSVMEQMISHHLYTQAGDYFNESSLFQDYKNALDGLDNPLDARSSQPSIDGPGTSHNYTVSGSNFTTTGSNSTSTTNTAATSFYKHDLPLHILFLLIITPLSYYWQIWLERTFPGRLKAQDLPPPTRSAELKQASFGDDDDGKEEAIVQKWIAQGKVKRASLSWWNTFVKWVLEMSVGGLWQATIAATWSFIIEDFKLGALTRNMKNGWYKWEILLRWLWSFVGVWPLLTLISFIVIPAHQRIVFLEGANLVFTTFIGFFIKAFLPWLESTEFMQSVVGNMTDALHKQQQEMKGPMPINIEL